MQTSAFQSVGAPWKEVSLGTRLALLCQSQGGCAHGDGLYWDGARGPPFPQQRFLGMFTCCFCGRSCLLHWFTPHIVTE